MGNWRRFFLRLTNALRPNQAEPDLTRELRSHLALLEDDFRRRGMPPQEAQLAARRAFGSIELAKELHRDARSFVRLDDVRRDLHYAARALRRNPGFSVVAIFTLALGIGATTAVFSFVNAVLLKPLLYSNSDRLASVLSTSRGEPIAVSPGDFLDWQAQSHSFAEMAAFTVSPYTMTGTGEPAAVLAGDVSARFAETLDAAPQLGRTFALEDETNPNQVVLISDHLWRRHFHSDPNIAGRSVTLEGTPYTIIGVMPEGFSFPHDLFTHSGGARALPDIDLWVPLRLRPGYRANAFLQVIARLKTGVTLDQARAEMAGISAALAQRFPPPEANSGVAVVSLREQIVRPVRPLLLTLFTAVCLLLLVACANVANLLLARGTAREREWAIRNALGSGRRRLVQQQLTESLLLGALGGAAGVSVAIFSVRFIGTLIPRGTLPRLAEVHVDSSVLAFSAIVSLLTSLTFGVLPALQSGGTDVTSALKYASTTHTARSRSLRFLVGAEVAVAFVLLVGAGLLLKSLQRLTGVDPGFRPDNVLALDVTLPEGSYPTVSEMRTFSSAVLEGLRHKPGVVASGAVNLLPIGGPSLMGDFILEGVPRPPGFIAAKPAVSPGYFQAMAIPLLQGRDFKESDAGHAPGVAIVTQQFARRAWPGQDALGKRLKLGFDRPENDPWLTVVGLVGDVKQSALADESMPAIYVPLLQAPRPFLLRQLTFTVRTGGDPWSIESTVREQIRRVDPLLPIARTATMAQLIADSVSEPRFRAILLGGFGLSALALITVGMFGVLAHFVARRTREIGIRMAVGAKHTDVSMLVIKQALKMTIAGVALGAGLAFVVTRLLARFLFAISPRDPVIFIGAGAALCLLALAASYVPARRAARVDPLVALRAE